MKKITGNSINTTNQMPEVEAEELAQYIGSIILIHGSIIKIRRMQGFAFVLLRTKRDVLQCVYSEDFSAFKLDRLTEESCVRFTAKVVEEARSKTGTELHLLQVEVLSQPFESSPIVINQKVVDTSLEHLLHFRPITLRNERQRAIFKLQEGITSGIRTFLSNERFTEIHSPKIVLSGAEGGANVFQLDYFGKTAYLAQSPQIYKQMMVGVFERVYEIGPVFRAEKHDTSRHLNEYTSIDFEMGYIHSFYEIMEMETKMLRFLMEYLNQNYLKEITLLSVRIPSVDEIPAVTFREAKELAATGLGKEFKDSKDLEPAEEKEICDFIYKTTGSEFVFVTHYPSVKRPFYAMDSQDNHEETESFDLLFRGIEITTGGQRIHQYEEQVKKMRSRNMDPGFFESYLMIHKYGMPPHGGLGIGLERLTSKLLEQDNVRLSTLFPRDRSRLEP